MLNLYRKSYMACYLAFCIAVVMWPSISPAATARGKYYQAEACYKKLRNSPNRQKYRDQWLACIEKFQAVYRHDPSGPWAAAGLYQSGELYQGLYKRSFKASDKKEALEAFNHIIAHYQQSRYTPKAKKAIQKYSLKAMPKIAKKSVGQEKQDIEKPVDYIAK